MLESKFQAILIQELYEMFGDEYCVILKNDSGYMQGIPDLVVFYRDRYAMLEVKPKTPISPDDYEPNQEWYIAHFHRMAFGAMICPENKEEIYSALQQAFGTRR